MKIDNLNLEEDIMIVAEIGNNHEGSYSLAENLIGLASEAGANAVKFQTFKTDGIVGPKDKVRYNQLKSFELQIDQFEKLSKIAKKNDLIFLSTPFDIESAKSLSSIVSAFKISSGDNTFYPLIETIANYDKPVILSSGLVGIDQLHYTKTFIEKIWNDNNIKQSLAVLHCVSSYPVPYEEANLLAISFLKEKLKCTIGYSDHTNGVDAAIFSAVIGARIIEKHFTIDKNYSSFRDHQLSADPKEMSQIVQKVKFVKTLMGREKKEIQPSEHNTIPIARRSIVAKHDLSSGHHLKWDDISWVRPAKGLPPGKEHLVLGRTLLQPITKGMPITFDSIDQ